MIDTAFAQLRYALSVVFGLPFSIKSLHQLIKAIEQTHYEFGSLTAHSAELLNGPALDLQTRRVVQLRRFQTIAKKAARHTPFYSNLFAQLDLDPARLSYDQL